VEVSLPNIVAGLKFSWPILKSGFHVLIASAVEEGGIWCFAQVCCPVLCCVVQDSTHVLNSLAGWRTPRLARQAFHWSVWVTLGATAVAVGVVITAAEMLAGGDRGSRKGLRGWSWHCMSKMVQVRG
jgi:hypothetical protein